MRERRARAKAAAAVAPLRRFGPPQRRRERGDFEQAQAVAGQLLITAAKEAERHPSERLRLVQEASEHEDAARWEQAEAAYRRVLTLAEAEGNEAALFKAHDDLRTLFTMRGLQDQALQEAPAAVAAALKTDLAALQVAALQGLFQCHLTNGDLNSAAAPAEQAVQITSGETSLLRARALLMRARCRTERAQTSESELDLAGAWQILAPQAQATLFAGVQSSLAVWWDVTARIRTKGQSITFQPILA